MSNLFGQDDQVPHKARVRERFLAMPKGATTNYQKAYDLMRSIKPRPQHWQANIRDEMHRLRDRGAFRVLTDGRTYVRT
jgi:hypothetical protein